MRKRGAPRSTFHPTHHPAFSSPFSGTQVTAHKPAKSLQRGQVASVNRHDGPEPGQGAVLDEVAFCCKALRCLTADRRSYDGQVDSSTPEVGYQCSGDEPLIQRRTAIILPDGRLIPYDYGAENSIDDVLNRVAFIPDDTTLGVLATFGYLGAAMPAITTLPTSALQRRWSRATEAGAVFFNDDFQVSRL